MPLAKLHDHLQEVTNRLDEITVALLSDGDAGRGSLMAERRLLLDEVKRTCAQMERFTARAEMGTSLALSSSLRLVKTTANSF